MRLRHVTGEKAWFSLMTCSQDRNISSITVLTPLQIRGGNEREAAHFVGQNSKHEKRWLNRSRRPKSKPIAKTKTRMPQPTYQGPCSGHLPILAGPPLPCCCTYIISLLEPGSGRTATPPILFPPPSLRNQLTPTLLRSSSPPHLAAFLPALAIWLFWLRLFLFDFF